MRHRPGEAGAAPLHLSAAAPHALAAALHMLAAALCLFAVLGPGTLRAQVFPDSLPSSSEAAHDPKNDSDAPIQPAEIEARIEGVQAELDSVEKELALAEPQTGEHLEVVRSRLRRIESILREEAARARAIDSPDAAVEDVSGPSGIDTEPGLEPSIFALNALYDALAARRQVEQGNDELLDSTRLALTEAKQAFEAAERERRKARSLLESATPSEQAQAEQRLRVRQLESRLAREEVHLLTLKTREVKRDDPRTAAATGLEERIRVMRERLALGEGDSSAGFARLAEHAAELRRARESMERRLATAELQLESAQMRFARQGEPSSELLDEVESLTARRDAIRQEIALVDAQRARAEAQRTLWQRWDAILQKSHGRTDLHDWEEATRDRLIDLDQASLERRGRVSDLELRAAKVEARLTSLPKSSNLRPALEEERASLNRLLDAQRQEIASLEADEILTRRLLDEIQQQTGRFDPLELATQAARTARDVWTYEITTVDDAPLSVGSFILALALFGVGFWAARRGSGLVGRIAERRFKLHVGGANALQTLSFYALLVGFMLMALRAVHFPLTAFTVLGGALAIGIGFGSQNVMNNFISGLILMLERPVRASDVVEIDGSHGIVERIGARSTQIRSTDGRHIIVPNSFFLESNVVNWTLSDELIRTKVSVGIVYGSPTRLAEELIHRVVDEDEQALQHPPPILIFSEFGDNSLNFDIYFWVRARSPMEVLKVGSRIRFAIDDLFRENGLVIAFPQRDVHLDSQSPIEVRLLER